MSDTENMAYTVPEEPQGQSEDERESKRAQFSSYHREQLRKLQSGEISEEDYIKDITERELHLDILADYDPLTGLLNRRGFMGRFHETLLDFRRNLQLKDEPTSAPKIVPGPILRIDVDDLKAANDEATGGSHDFGDLILQEVAKTLATTLRPKDLVARFGGDEYVVLLAGETQEAGLKVADRLAWDIAENTEAELGYRQTVSIGLAMLPQEFDLEQLVISKQYRENVFEGTSAISDKACYATKSRGRNGVSYPLPEGNFQYIPTFNPHV